MTRFTRVGAEAGAISLPPTSAPFAGGGGGGTNAAPPPLEALCAIAAGARTTRHATNSAAKSSLLLKVEGILFRTPTGLADGLALKELRAFSRRFAPVAVATNNLVPPFRVTADSAWRGSYQMSRRASPSPLMLFHTSSARERAVLPTRGERPSPLSTRTSDHEISAMSASAIASTVR